MTDEQLAALKVPVLHFPTVLGAVVVTFNVNHIHRLRFDGETLAGIFLGKITNWKDPAIRRLNSVQLPDAYPIASFTWLLVAVRIPDVQKGQALKKFLEWMLSDGQALAPSLLYAPLPPVLATNGIRTLAAVRRAV